MERVSQGARNNSAELIPIRFVATNNLNKDDKLLLAFDAIVLSQILGSEVGIGKIIHGENHATTIVNTEALASNVRRLIASIESLLSSNSPPDLVLNRHCPECEFQSLCRPRAAEKDELSLLSGMTGNERNRHRSKGIFTVTQLSYTFRPRRTPKRAKNPAKPRYLALQALAIRENTVYIHGSPVLPDSKTQVYLDIEGLSDHPFYYLIGALVVSNGRETFFTSWADCQADELDIFAQFIEIIDELPDFRVFHFGDYEVVALKRVRARLPEHLRPKIDAILERMTNALSVIHHHVYLPIYSNGLKDIGRFLRFKRTDENATGLQSIIWRKSWAASGDPDIKGRLVQYNQDDCRALKLVCDFVRRLNSSDSTAVPAVAGISTVHTKELTKDRPHWDLFRAREHVLPEFEQISKCAYFDYQRDRVFVRTHPQLKTADNKNRQSGGAWGRINELRYKERRLCPRCRSRKIEKCKQLTCDLPDLKFLRAGVKFYRWKSYIAAPYESLCSEILQSILSSPIIHVDETTVRLRGQSGYVWVFATMDKVYYFYKSSREGSFLQDMLRPFSGVLISDFYTAYDSLNCKQQKCLVHFIRDIDDDLLRNPLDVELKGIGQEFGALLRTIIQTVDRYGLKSRYLRKHKRATCRFLSSIASTNFSSAMADRYKKRFQKSGDKMFTFLDHDGVPWNNTNAEHAIKLFAKYRRTADGYFTERSLTEYLALATVLETCAFNHVSALKFLLSDARSLAELFAMARRRPLWRRSDCRAFRTEIPSRVGKNIAESQ